MNIKPLIVIAILGIGTAIASAIIYDQKITPQSPVAVSYNPYEKGIYATGIIESRQTNSSNINIFPEVSGKVDKVYVTDGQLLQKGDAIFSIDSSIQEEVVAKDKAQLRYAQENLVNLDKQLEKIQKAYHINPKSVSLNSLDNAIYAVKLAQDSVSVAAAQYRQDIALLDKYIVRTPIDGTILRVASTEGDYVSPVGTYDGYTEGMLPVVQMGVIAPDLQVRAYVDEILVPNLPNPSKLEAKMLIRGLNNYSIPLKFTSMQPYTIPNIQLSNQREERVDVRVLPIVFKFKKPADINVFPGQLVDIYLKGNA